MNEHKVPINNITAMAIILIHDDNLRSK